MKACLRLAEDTQNQHGSVVVLDIRPMDNDRQYQAKCVDNDMAFASVDLLSSIVTPLATDLRRFDGLTVDDRRTGGFLAPQATPKHVPERIVNSSARFRRCANEGRYRRPSSIWEIPEARVATGSRFAKRRGLHC